MRLSSKTLCSIVVLLIFSFCPIATRAQVKQPKEVIEAYAVCNRFQSLISKDLDFSAAFEATFAQDLKRRREIAIRDGEFGAEDFSSVDSPVLIGAYKNQMQLFYLMLPLVGPQDSTEETLFFPPNVKEMFKRKQPQTSEEFPAYAAQLEKDVATLRAHLNDLAAKHPRVTERIAKFKSETLATKLTPPRGRRVEPQRGASGGRSVWDNEPYYQFDGYTVVREGKQMRIVSIQFFTRLF